MPKRDEPRIARFSYRYSLKGASRASRRIPLLPRPNTPVEPRINGRDHRSEKNNAYLVRFTMQNQDL